MHCEIMTFSPPTPGDASMSAYNSGALAALQGNLKLNVRIRPHLIDLLEEEAGGFMTRAEARMVLQDDINQMERLIDVLRGKGDKEFHTFCEMLRKSNYNHWANALLQEAEKLKPKSQIEGVKYGICK